MSQEWVSTPLYDDNNKDHKRIIEEINFGNSLPNMRTWNEAEASGKSVCTALFACLVVSCAMCGWWMWRVCSGMPHCHFYTIRV